MIDVVSVDYRNILRVSGDVYIKQNTSNTLHDKQHVLASYTTEVVNNVSTVVNTVHMITPTYARLSQTPDLTRLAQTLSLVPSLHWIVVEDAHSMSTWITQLALDKAINFTHLAVHDHSGTGRGSHQRNKGLDWIIGHDVPRGDVIYFGDDDNSYDTRLFDTVSN